MTNPCSERLWRLRVGPLRTGHGIPVAVRPGAIRRRGKKTFEGLTLVEVLITLLITGLCCSGLFGGLLGLQRSLQGEGVVWGGRWYAQAPSIVPVPDALAFHACLGRHLSEARATYVFGGLSGTEMHAATLEPLQYRGLPEIRHFHSGLPLSASAFVRSYAAELGASERGAGEDAFSLLIVGLREGRLAVNAFVQVRSQAIHKDGRRYLLRDARLWSHGEEERHYSFVEPVRDHSLPFVGAVHGWQPHWRGSAAAERPVSVAFPDPWQFQGTRADVGEARPGSRFLYLVGVTP